MLAGGESEADRQPIAVVHVIESLRRGGAEQLLYTTVRHLDRRLFRPIVVALFSPQDLRRDFEELGVPVHCFNARGPFGLARAVISLTAVLRRSKAGIVHTHLFYANVSGRIAGVLARVPVVISSVHNTDYSNEDTGRARFKIRKLVDKITVRYMSSLVIAVSEAVRGDCQQHLGLDRVQVLHNWIDVDQFERPRGDVRVGARKEFGFSEGEWVLINVAKLRRRQKGQDELIRALREIRITVPQTRLLLVGEGPDQRGLEALVTDLGLEGAVVFAGRRDDISRLLAMADVFVFPSRYEGFGIALVEAMAMGKPVIASRLEGIAEIVTDGVDGLLVEPRSPAAIAEAAVRLYRDPVLRDKLGSAARTTVLQRFSAASAISRLEEIYLSSLRSRTTSAN